MLEPRRNGWARVVVPIMIAIAGALIGYGELKSGVSQNERDIARLEAALDHKADFELVREIRDQLREINGRLTRLEARRP